MASKKMLRIQEMAAQQAQADQLTALADRLNRLEGLVSDIHATLARPAAKSEPKGKAEKSAADAE